MSLEGCIGGLNGEDRGLYDGYFTPSGGAKFVQKERIERTGATILGKGVFGCDPNGFDTPYMVPHFVLWTLPWPCGSRGCPATSRRARVHPGHLGPEFVCIRLARY